MSEIEKALVELKALMKFRAERLGYEEEFRGLGLTSRKNLCLHPSVKREKSGNVVDARCRSLTAGFIKEKKEKGEDVEVCVYHDVSLKSPYHWLASDPDALSRTLISSSLTILSQMASGHSTVFCGTASSTNSALTSPPGAWCVALLFLLRLGADPLQMQYCNVIIYSYHYLLDPKIAERVSKDLSKDCIVVFDEAHNIDNVCIESLSTDITEDSLRRATRGAQNLETKINEMRDSDQQKLQDEYEKLVEGLRGADDGRQEDSFMANPSKLPAKSTCQSA
jgi:DNA excision repair protein ERCC-2